jgi:hypothetical protein
MSYSDKQVERKQFYVDVFGGGCQECGYNTCLRALQFHHVDKSEKELWSGKDKYAASYEEINHHPERFKLLCANCHIALHDAEDKEKNTRQCVYCGNDFLVKNEDKERGHGRLCSKKCQHADRRKSSGEPESVKKRIEANIVKDDNGCWLWQGHIYKGHFSPHMAYTHPDRKRRMFCSVRTMSLFAYKGLPIEKPRRAMMACGVNICVNPDHMKVFEGKASRHISVIQ